MPLFDYRCKECGHVTEFLERADTKVEHLCEQCGSKKTEKIVLSCLLISYSFLEAGTNGS